MKWFHFYENGRIRLGVQTLGGPVNIAATAARRHLAAPADLHELLAGGDDALAQVERLLAGKTVPVAQPVRYAPAVPRPGKILCVGLNYRDHTAEIAMDKPDQPVLFSKFSNTIAAHQQDIPFPEEAAKLDYEAELVAVVGRGGSHIAEEDAPAHIFGYTVGNDVSERVLQFQSTQWLMGKSWDHFAPIGPYVVTADEVDAGNLDIACRSTARCASGPIPGICSSRPPPFWPMCPATSPWSRGTSCSPARRAASCRGGRQRSSTGCARGTWWRPTSRASAPCKTDSYKQNEPPPGASAPGGGFRMSVRL